MLTYIQEGWSLIANPSCLLLLCGGVTLGLIFGCIPGLTTNMCLAVMLPICFSMSPMQAICTLIGIYVGGCSGGLIGATLINIPGTPASVATTFDGYPMTKKGQAGKALAIGIYYSFLGTLIGFIFLVTISPLLASIGLKFGYYEFFALGIFTLTIISGVVTDSILKGLGAAAIGVFIAMIGIAPVDGAVRLTFGFRDLMNGFRLLPLTVGFYAVGALLDTAEKGAQANAKIDVDYKVKGFGVTWQEFKDNIWNMLRSGIIGTFIGILPGMGANISNLVAYSVAKNSSKYPEKFGTGIIDGVIASETSNNATLGGAIIPLLTLGIPGDGSTGLLLGCLIVFGITPGPLLFQNQKDLVYAIFILVLLSSIVTLIVVRGGLPLFVKLLKVPKTMLLPIFILLSTVGAFGSTKLIFDVWVCFIAGIIAYVFKQLNIPLTPLVIAFIISPTIEVNLRRGLMIAPNRSLWDFFSSPIFIVLTLATIVVIVFSVIKEVRRAKARLAARPEQD